MHPTRTPLKTEFGFSAAEANRGSVKPVAAASVVPIKWRRDSECVVMPKWNAKAQRLLPKSRGNQRDGELRLRRLAEECPVELIRLVEHGVNAPTMNVHH